MNDTSSTIEKKPETDAVSVSLIVFGKDKDGKPHASAFAETDAALATKAAGLMGMRTLAVDTEEHRSVALLLPEGRVFASGRGVRAVCEKGAVRPLERVGRPSDRRAG